MNVSLKELIKRNTKLYFKDKSTFFTSLLSPMILFVLFVTFLGGVYESSFRSFIPDGFTISDNHVTAFTVSWLMSSLIGVSSVTIAFCSNIIMAQDKINGGVHDLLVAPIKKSTLALSYYIANVITTTIVCFCVMGLGFAYIATIGWYFSVTDILFIILDVLLCILFGTALAALVENFVSTQGGIGAVASLVSALYGFLCGAYMPISQFSEPIRNFICILPGTYGVSLLRGHYMSGVLRQLPDTWPAELTDKIRDGFDVNIYCFNKQVQQWQMYVIIGVAILVFLGLYVLMNKLQAKKQ